MLTILLMLVATIAPQIASTALQSSVVEHPNLAYAAEVAHQKHRLDLFAPSTARNAPVLIFVHGGDWHEQDRKAYSFLGRSFAAEGFVVVVPSYRLWPTVGGAQMADDIAQATAWTLRHAWEYGGKPNSVVLSGHSAGGHLVALISLDPKYLRKYGITLKVIRGVIAISGVDDLRYLGGPVVEGAFGRKQDDRWRLSPLRYVHRGAPPFEIVCARGEIRAFCSQARTFFLALRLYGVNALFYLGSGSHGSEIIAAAFPSDPLHARIVQFVKSHT